MNFDNFQTQNQFPKQLGLEKQMEKVGSLELWSLNCQKLCFFSQIFADVSKKSEAVIAIYVYASESSRLALLENDVDYYAMTL